MNEIISMKEINKSYTMGTETLKILKNVNFTVEKGDFVSILGPSGSGKSTLMNIIGCMDNFDSGEYLLNGTSLKGQKDSDLTKIRNQEIGFIFQKYQLIPSYTVMQNIMLPLLIRGHSKKQAREYCELQLDAVGLLDRLHHKPSELSGGQQQRVAIARALIGEPNILLADEPTGALDSATGKEVLTLFKKLNSVGNTIIMITHDLSVAQNANRIIKIIDGELFS